MEKLSSISRIIQVEYLLENCVPYILKVGHRPLILCEKKGCSTVTHTFVKILCRYGLMVKLAYVNEWSQNELEKCVEMGFQHRTDHIIGLGNNYAMTFTEAVGDFLDLPVVLIPTELSSPFINLPIVEKKYMSPLFNDSIQLIIANRELLVRQSALGLLNGIINALLGLVAIQKVNDTSLTSLIDVILIREFENVLLKNVVQGMEDFKLKRPSKELQDIIEVLLICMKIKINEDGWGYIQKLEKKLIERYENLVNEELKRNTFLYLLLTYMIKESDEIFMDRLQRCYQLQLISFSDFSNPNDMIIVFKEIQLEIEEIY